MEEDERIKIESAGEDYDPYAPLELSDEDMYGDIENVNAQIEEDNRNLFSVSIEEDDV